MNVKKQNAIIPIVPNVLAQKVNDADTIVNALIAQVTGTVRWRETMQYFEAENITDQAEIGVGKVLTGLAKRDLKNINSFSVNSISEIENFINNL